MTARTSEDWLDGYTEKNNTALFTRLDIENILHMFPHRLSLRDKKTASACPGL
jgi:hypothetical protein